MNEALEALERLMEPHLPRNVAGSPPFPARGYKIGSFPDYDIVRAALTEAPQGAKVDSPWGKQSKWRHVKTGNIYTVVGTCRLEHSNSPAYLYVDKAGIIWARDKDEFLDGRFEPLDTHHDLVKKSEG